MIPRISWGTPDSGYTPDPGPSGWTGSEPLPDRPVHEYATNTQWCPFNPYRYMTGPAQEGSN